MFQPTSIGIIPASYERNECPATCFARRRL